jgi:hypothetical protein
VATISSAGRFAKRRKSVIATFLVEKILRSRMFLRNSCSLLIPQLRGNFVQDYEDLDCRNMK